MASTLDSLAYEAGRLLKFVASIVSAESGPRSMLAALGWDLPPGATDIGLVALDLSALVRKVDELEEALSSGADGLAVDEKFIELFIELQHALSALRATVDGISATGDYLDKTRIKSEFLPRLNGFLATSRVGTASPTAFLLLQFFGVVTVRHFAADPSIYQVDHLRVSFDWNALGRLFSDPVGLLETRYGWGTAAFDGEGFVANLSSLVEAFGEPVRLRPLPRRVEEQLAGRLVPEADTTPATQLIASIVRGDAASGIEAGISLFPLRASTPGGTDAGVAICPFVHGAAQVSFPLTPQLKLDFDATVALDSGIALQFRPSHPVSLKAGLLGSGGVVDSIDGRALVRLVFAPPSGSRHTLLALPGGGIVEADSIAFAGGVDASQGVLSPSFAARIAGGHAVLRPDGADSFLASLIPANGVEAKFDFGVRWSAQGFSFEASASAAIDIPLNASISGLTIDSLHIEALPSAAGLAFELSITGGAAIGPLGVTLERFGTLVTLASHDGNLGPIDVSLDFKAPSGAGLVVDAAGVSGGGFLAHAKQEYSGVLQLKFMDWTMQAFGLITTEVAGGEGYSLLALIDADFPPIQLGWGFTLNGIGGLIAVHRTAAVDALRAGLKADALSNILFPKNAITNAPQILAALDTFFPTAPGRFLFGPMALIEWGAPTMLTAALAVIIELPEPVRIILLARLAARIPSETETLVRINMDALGVLDLSQSSLALDATLFDSRLLNFTLSGDMALRANWAGQREFLLSVGGFHPRFTPPPSFPPLKRLSIDMPSGIISTLHLETYLAITSNTLQLGANLHVVIGISAFSLEGHLGFDALFQRDPFHFDGDISGSVAVSVEGEDFLSVSLDATLTGPAPWYISGKFKVHIVFFDVHKSFSETWGDDAAAEQITAVDVEALLTKELSDPRSWGSQLPDGVPALVTTRDLQNSAVVVAHPLARLEVHERTVPLGLGITRFGAAPLSGANHFAISDFQIGGTAVTYQSVEDDFAPAQFFDLTDDEKLEQPSFERHDAGVRMDGGRVSSGAPQRLVTNGSSVNKTLQYETFFVDQPGGELRTDDPKAPKYTRPIGEIETLLSSGSAGRATMMRAGNRRYTAPGNPIHVAEPAFVVVDTATLAPAGLGPVSGNVYSDARALLREQLNQFPGQQGHLQIVATHEMMLAA